MNWHKIRTFVYLSSIGINFGAGFSGGLAYVYDKDDDFTPKCNHEMVDLFSIEEDEDIQFLKESLTTFVQKTDSEVAKNILNNFEEELNNFTKVFPKGMNLIYKLILKKIK